MVEVVRDRVSGWLGWYKVEVVYSRGGTLSTGCMIECVVNGVRDSGWLKWYTAEVVYGGGGT